MSGPTPLDPPPIRRYTYWTSVAFLAAILILSAATITYILIES